MPDTATEDSYKKWFGKSESDVVQAQRELVVHTLSLALQELYDEMKKHHCGVSTDISIDNKEITLVNTQGHPCISAKEALNAILSLFPDNEFGCIAAFNQLTKRNKFDLSLKSSGYKSVESITEKMEKKGEKPRHIKDILRLTVISSHHEILDHFAIDFSENFPYLKFKLEPWNMTKTGVLKQTGHFRMIGLGAEMQFVPREQSYAMRISHPFYEIERSYLTYEKSHSQERKSDLILKYTPIAELINELLSDDILPGDYWKQANKILNTKDMATLTFDAASEGGENTIKRQADHPDFSSIFKNQGELKLYRDYLRAVAPDINKKAGKPVFPMPALNADSSDEDITAALRKLAVFTRLTHACHMQHASMDMRKIWVQAAQQINQREKTDIIPSAVIESVCRGVYGAHIPLPSQSTLEAGYQK